MTTNTPLSTLRERLDQLETGLTNGTFAAGSDAYALAERHIAAISEEIALALTRPLIGTVYLDPTNGNTYRLTGYYKSYFDSDSDGERPGYMRFTSNGAGSEDTLPEGAYPIWVPRS